MGQTNPYHSPGSANCAWPTRRHAFLLASVPRRSLVFFYCCEGAFRPSLFSCSRRCSIVSSPNVVQMFSVFVSYYFFLPLVVAFLFWRCNEIEFRTVAFLLFLGFIRKHSGAKANESREMSCGPNSTKKVCFSYPNQCFCLCQHVCSCSSSGFSYRNLCFQEVTHVFKQ